MSLFFISIVVIALVVAAMAIGVLAGRSPIKGSCGGMAALGMKDSCEICGGSAQRCDEASRRIDDGNRKRDAALFYPASR